MSTQEIRPYLALYHDVLEEVQPVLSPSEFSVFLVIYRDTIGWSREQVALSYADLKKRTGISERQVQRILKSLIKAGYIRLCSAVGRWGMYVYALAKRFITGQNVQSSMDMMAIVQNPLPDTPDKMSRVVWTKRPEFSGHPVMSTVDKMSIEPSPQPAPEAAPDEPKETLKEMKEIIKKEEVITEEEKEEEKRDGPLRASEWDTALETIEPQVSRPNFFTWFKSVRAIKRGDTFILQVESSFHRRYLHRYESVIRSVLEPLLPPSMEILIATAEELAAAPAEAAAMPERSSA